ncbi:hypothetical protein CGRA01v4_11617 [Colletotrichum graminicola]|nr:hypothetical protein CGRA01v4_11617 [Colletotrichum graminicola]
MDLNPEGAHCLCATHAPLSRFLPLTFPDTCSEVSTVRIRLVGGISLVEPESHCVRSVSSSVAVITVSAGQRCDNSLPPD